MAGPLSFKDAPAEFRAVGLALRQVEQPVRRAINQDMRATMAPEWVAALTHHQDGDRRLAMVLAGARLAAGNPPSLVAAASTRRWGTTRLVPAEHWPGFVYGTNGRRDATYTRTYAGGKPHSVTRNVLAGHPSRRRQARSIGPAVADVLPRIAAYWVQSVVRIVMDAAEGKKG